MFLEMLLKYGHDNNLKDLSIIQNYMHISKIIYSIISLFYLEFILKI